MDGKDRNAGIQQARLSTSGDLPEDPPDGLVRRDFSGMFLLCSAALWFGNFFVADNRDHILSFTCATYANQHVIHRLLDPGRGLVEPARGLGHKLAQEITVIDGIDCVVNEV
jgi:hypothetical protein